MTLLKSALFILGTGSIIYFVRWWYRAHEEPVRGRVWAAGLRSAAICFAYLILLNPTVSTRQPTGEREQAVLLDASLSMSGRLGPGPTSVWQAAAESAGRVDGVWLFGGEVPAHSSKDSLPPEPFFTESRLAPAVRTAATSAVSLVAYTDGRISDISTSLEEARRRGVGLQIVVLGTEYPGIGISELSAPTWAELGDTVVVRAEIVARMAERESVTVEIVDEAERVQAALSVRVPAGTRFSPAHLALPVSGAVGMRRYSARLRGEELDLEGRDNARTFYIDLQARPLGPVLVSLTPDWEASFLLSSLERLSEAPVHAYVWLADSLVDMSDYTPASQTQVIRRAREAPLLVLQGYGAGSPAWVQSLAQSARRLLVLPAGAQPFELPGWGVRIGPPASGEWYVAGELPSSPLALDVGGYPIDALAPVLRVRRISVDGAAWPVLNLQLLRRGGPLPALLAGRSDGRRWAVASGEGYWRWAFRPGPSRQLYRALWTAVAGWLMEGERVADSSLKPLETVVSRGESIEWLTAPSLDSMSVEVRETEGAVVWSGSALEEDSLEVALPPGRYVYRAQAWRGGAAVSSAQGPVEVEEFSREFLPGASVTADSTAATFVAGESAEAHGRGLATLGWPYLLLMALFSAEWVVRRLSGLR
ncbi:MAG: hypothetical protein JSU87_07685 [Gemmatimonadota bacterium]|nr:MAG: hypothetical protein JSU87_07685 [Gemmatimonadota bacterium]